MSSENGLWLANLEDYNLVRKLDSLNEGIQIIINATSKKECFNSELCVLLVFDNTIYNAKRLF